MLVCRLQFRPVYQGNRIIEDQLSEGRLCNKRKGAKSSKQGKQRTARKTPLVTDILNRLIHSRAETLASNPS
jgi:hypothetical protein